MSTTTLNLYKVVLSMIVLSTCVSSHYSMCGEASGQRKAMKVLVLQSSADGSVFDGLDPVCTPEIYLKNLGHEVESVSLKKGTVASQLTELSRQSPRFDVVVNLCDGAWDEDRAGAEVVELLERLGMPYTGANGPFYDPPRIDMKKVALANGLSTPAWAFAYHKDEVLGNVISCGLSYPMLVKHFNSYSSIGLTRDSKVHDQHALLRQAELMIDKYGGCMIEEFIEGREFTVLVAESDCGPPITYRLVECSFPPGDI
jgi:D-alanine-D-alanine ligase-like ATP-grasp enzyme